MMSGRSVSGSSVSGSSVSRRGVLVVDSSSVVDLIVVLTVGGSGVSVFKGVVVRTVVLSFDVVCFVTVVVTMGCVVVVVTSTSSSVDSSVISSSSVTGLVVVDVER